MKKIIFFLVFISNIFLGHAQVNLSQGLKLYLPFNGNAQDLSGNNNNASVNGATLTTDEYGNANSAFEFDGINDFLEVINNSNLNFSDSLSLCAKIYSTGFYNGTCQNNSIIQKGNLDFGNGHYSLRIGDEPYDNNCSLQSASFVTAYGQLKSSTSLPIGTSANQAGNAPYINLNQWYCLAYIYTGDSIKMYINSVLKYAIPYNINNAPNTESVFIGKNNNSTYPNLFKGKIDEVRIYNRALNFAEVQTLCSNCINMFSTNNFIASNDTTICTNTNVQLNLQSNLPLGISYTWVGSNLNNNSIANPLASPTANITYYCTITDAQSCIAIDSVNIFQNINANAGPDITKCQGDTANLFTTGPGAALWFPGNGLSNILANNPKCFVGSSTTYSLTLTTTNGCVSYDTITVTVSPNPLLNILPNTYTYCTGNAGVQLNAVGNGVFSWASNPTLNATNIADPIATPFVNTIYTVTLTNSIGCTNTATALVNVAIGPIINAVGTDTICKGASTPIAANGGGSYTWQPATMVSNANIANPLASPSVTTTYTVIGTNSIGCTNSSTVRISLAPPLNIIITGDSNFCVGDSSQLIAYGGLNYTWAPLNNGTIVSNNSMIVYPPQSTIYTVVATDEFGCTDTKTYDVQIQDFPVVTVSKSGDADCNDKSVTLSAGGATSYIWQPSNTLVPNNQATVIATPLDHTTYTVTATKGKCVVTNTIEVKVFETINAKLFVPNAITANSDGINDGFKIYSNASYKIFDLKIYNRWGQLVFESNSPEKIWYGEESGAYTRLLDTYYYILKLQDDCGKLEKRGDVVVVR